MRFVVICPWCGAHLDVVDVADGQRWGEAAQWAALAQIAHERDSCTGRPT